jgi:hypothetical protein
MCLGYIENVVGVMSAGTWKTSFEPRFFVPGMSKRSFRP